MESITFQYPVWYLFICLGIGLGAALLLYFRNDNFKEQPRWLNWLLGGLRFLAISLICFFLLSPLLKTAENQVRKPVIVLAQDVSESVENALPDKEAYLQSIEKLRDELSEDFDVQTYSFGTLVREGLDTAFNDKVSNISEVLKKTNDLYSGENLGAVILATDGIYNEGSNPVYASDKLGVPVYTIALGDTTLRRDLTIKRVFHNKIAYQGDKFSVQVDIAARNTAGSTTNLTAYKVGPQGTTRLSQETITIDRADFFTTRELILDADQSGVQRYRIGLSPVANEERTANNSKDIFVDVLDARQKIIVIANAPHPDLTALKQSVSSNDNYEVTVAYAGNFRENVADYDFAILHQLPSRTNNAETILQQLNEQQTPRWFILGMQTDFNRFNTLQSMLSIQTDGRNTNDVEGMVAGNFNLFKLDEEVRNEIKKYPPLLAPFGEFTAGANGQALLLQRIRKIETPYPLLMLGEENGLKTGVLTAEGLWKWRLFDYLDNNNHERFDALISKVVQYLSLKEDKRKFRVNLPKNIFNENEQVFFDAELYNNSYELINEPDVRMEITNEEGKEFTFTFNRMERAYSLNAGLLPVGNYRFRARTVVNGEELTYNGQFSVQPIQLELYETTADHRLLRLLSDKFAGNMVNAASVASIAADIQAQSAIKPVIYTTSKTKSLINLRWLFGILALLLAAEWFLRRYYGSY